MEFNEFVRRELERTQKQPDDLIRTTRLKTRRFIEILRGAEPTGKEQEMILEFLNSAKRVSPQNDPAVTVISTTH